MKRADYISQDSVTVTDDWGAVYTLDALDDVSVQVTGNPVEVRFSPATSSGGYRWGVPMKLFAGGWNDITDKAVGAFSHFQFRNAAAGSPGVIDIRAFCHGGA